LIGLDTNVVIRYLVQDDPKQASAAVRFIEKTLSVESPGFLSHIVLCEIVWVLEDCYSQSRAQIATILQTLFTARQIIVQETELAWKALRVLENRGGDFSDALIGLAGAAAGCTHTVTFDKEAAQLDGFVMLG
jgi:predicted nucleic-acid-binding protein